MARTKIVSNKDSLDVLIPQYGEQNTQCNSLKKVVSDLNTRIKQAIKSKALENKDISVEGWNCKLSVSEDISVDEDMLIEVLKKYDVPVLYKKTCIDSDKLENLIYFNKLDNEVLLEIDKCKTKVAGKEVLRCTKVKN